MCCNVKSDSEYLLPSKHHFLQEMRSEVGVMPPFTFSMTSIAIGASLLGFTAIGFQCTDCPLDGFVIGSAIGLSLSGLSFFTDIYYHLLIQSKEQKEQYQCKMVCITIISIAGIVLNSISLNYYIHRCTSLKC